jgi:hypothetical protein
MVDHENDHDEDVHCSVFCIAASHSRTVIEIKHHVKMKLDQRRHFFKQLLKYNLGILLNGQNSVGTLIVITKQFVSV